MNLLQETLKAISDVGLTINDIDFIGSNDGQYVIDHRLTVSAVGKN